MKLYYMIILLMLSSCCPLNQQRIGDILDDLKDNIENVRSAENGQQIDYIQTRIKHLEAAVKP
jgi:hypothetical protein